MRPCFIPAVGKTRRTYRRGSRSSHYPRDVVHGASLLKTMTHDQGSEMAATLKSRPTRALKFTLRIRKAPGSAGVLRQCLPKGTVLSLVTQERLDEIADLLKTRPRQTLGWKFPAMYWLNTFSY